MHVNQLPRHSATPDAEIAAFADANDYVVITKDEDFRTGYLLREQPRKLIHIRTGNGIKDHALMELIGRHLPDILRLDTCRTFYLEIDANRFTAIIAA